jgi:hypothetical protein
VWTEFKCDKTYPLAEFCEHGNELPNSVGEEEYLDWLSGHQPLKDSLPLSQFIILSSDIKIKKGKAIPVTGRGGP